MPRTSTPVAKLISNLADEVPLSFGQAILGLVLGCGAFLVLGHAAPVGVVYAPIVDGKVVQKTPAVIVRLWGSAMILFPFVVSGLCGVFAHRSAPASLPAALLRMVGVALILLLASWIGSAVIKARLSTGGSSDVGADLATIAYVALCVSLAAPLSSALTRRRSIKREPLVGDPA